jgi:hypothetical protein
LIGCFSAKISGDTYLLYSHSGNYLSQFSPDCFGGFGFNEFYRKHPTLKLDQHDNVYFMSNQENNIEIFNLNGTRRGVVRTFDYGGFDNHFRARGRLAILDNWIEILYGDYENRMIVTLLSFPSPGCQQQQMIQTFEIHDVYDFIGVLSTGRFLFKSGESLITIVE